VAERGSIPIICGPTASGKTSLALEYAETHSTEIISADSRQIIRRLDIGTAKPTPEEMRLAPFHLVNVVEPGERYSAFRFMTEANQIVKETLARGNIPLVVGGTGLYLRALTDGVVEMDDVDMAIREELEKQADEKGLAHMYGLLEKVDPLEAAKVHPNNRRRVLRALEIFRMTGKSKSELVVTGTYKKSEYSFEYYCLAPPRKQLYEIIDTRVDMMLKAGLLEEVKGLAAEGMTEKVRKARVIGYDELLDFLEDRSNLDEAVRMIKQNTRRYAKRQMTWFRRQIGCQFFPDRDILRKELVLP
jgi:tRNA dimethylallyltransferase